MNPFRTPSRLPAISRRSLLTYAVAGAAALRLPPALAAEPEFAPFLGAEAAAVRFWYYVDSHCPICRRMEDEIRAFSAQRPDVRISFMEFPILKADSELAARIALSAHLRGRYFEVHEQLLRHNGEFTGKLATEIAQQLGVDPTEFRRDMGSAEVNREIRQNLSLGQRLELNGTPILLWNGGSMAGGYQTRKQLAEIAKKAGRAS